MKTGGPPEIGWKYNTPLNDIPVWKSNYLPNMVPRVRNKII
jgi:hypothetical protein